MIWFDEPQRKEGSGADVKRVKLKGWNPPAFCHTGPDKTSIFRWQEYKSHK
jgi:hypothetical protein